MKAEVFSHSLTTSHEVSFSRQSWNAVLECLRLGVEKIW